MKKIQRAVFFFGCILAVFRPGQISGAEYVSGRIKLVLHETTGRFSLYYLSDFASEKYEPFFVDEDPRTSFITVMVNNMTYKLGDSAAFRFRAGGTETNPALIFESSFLSVREEFSFIKTKNSTQTNGVAITIKAVNLGPHEASVGFRFLLDTSLGEGGARTPFITGRQSVVSETVIEKAAGEKWWISRNERISLMGSISEGVEKTPELVHFANWKRLNEVPWKINYTSGRNFNYLPYSIGDSAVSYYFDPGVVSRGQERSCSLLLAAEDPAGFTAWRNGSGGPAVVDIPDSSNASDPRGAADFSGALPAEASAQADAREQDLALLREFIARVDAGLAGTLFVSDDEMDSMEARIARIRIRYGLP
ncbi:MAG: hypothetical protein LBD71_05295 [Treponema sp.]|jgi:hypothetical protein|nr:hypothetical protein [Treponema sp.]